MPGRLPQQLDLAGTITPATDQLIIAQGSADVRRATLTTVLTAAGAIATWQTWAFPFVAGITLGNGVWVGRYRDTGTEVIISGNLTLGSTSAVTAGIIIQTPTSVPFELMINLAGFDVSTGLGYNGYATPNSGSFQSFILGPNGNSWAAATPFTWASGDRIWVNGTYPK